MGYKLKRTLDFILSIILITFLSWLFVLITIGIKVESKGPVLFKQRRVGKNKKYFQIYKFRTMRIDAPKDVPTHQLQNSNSYITKLGSFLRKTSLDELPQLFNILKGDMSFVGPRPALWNQYDLIAERDKYNANDVLPGITGLAQISGRDELPIHVKARYDGIYVKNMSFTYDIMCIIKTVWCVFKQEGVKEGC